MLYCLAACVFYKYMYGHKAVVIRPPACGVTSDAMVATLRTMQLQIQYHDLSPAWKIHTCGWVLSTHSSLPRKKLYWTSGLIQVHVVCQVYKRVGLTRMNSMAFSKGEDHYSPPAQKEHDRVLRLHIHSIHMGVEKRKNRVRDFLFWHNKVNRGSSGSQWYMPRAMWCKTQRAPMVTVHPH